MFQDLFQSLAADSSEGPGPIAETVDFSVVDTEFENSLQPIAVTVPQLWGQARTRLLGDACRRLQTSVFRKYISNPTQAAVCTLKHSIQGNTRQL